MDPHFLSSLIGHIPTEMGEMTALKKLRLYFNQVVKGRKGEHWQAFYKASRGSLGTENS